MIRVARLDDMPQILSMAERFVSHYGLAVYDEATCRDMATRMIESEDAIILLADHGMLGGMAYPHFFNRNEYMAQELFWWIDRDHRGGLDGVRLLNAFEAWAKEKKVSRIAMVCLPAQKSVGQFYQKRGYEPLESAFVMRLQ